MTIITNTKQKIVNCLILIFLWLTIVYLVKYFLALLTLLATMGMAFIAAFGEAFKNNMLLLSIWVCILGLFKGFSMSRITYRAIIGIVSNEDDQCSICLMPKCDMILINCKHYYHQKCLQEWKKQKSICPNCRVPLDFDDMKLSKKLIYYIL